MPSKTRHMHLLRLPALKVSDGETVATRCGTFYPVERTTVEHERVTCAVCLMWMAKIGRRSA